MKKALVTYFSATGTTAALAKRLANSIDATLYEIQPVEKYTSADLDWTDKQSRTTKEKDDKSFRPPIKKDGFEVAPYEVIFVAFPIWWYVAPTIINTFLEQYDLTGKTIVPVATSGGSGLGNTVAELRPSAKGARIEAGRRFAAHAGENELQTWAKQFL